MTGPVLYQQFVMHMRLQGAAIYSYNILDAGKKVIGAKSVTLDKKKKTETTTYALNGREEIFTSRDDFLAAYIQQLRDAEWEAAKPKDTK